MKEKKRCLAHFTFYDRTGIQKFLEKKAAQGWLLEKIAPVFWIFRRIEPKKVHFAVTYFSKASIYDPEPTEQQRIFQAFCEYSGWKLSGIHGPLQIYYNEAEDPVPIETDPRMELKTIHASAKRNFLPSYFLLLAVAFMQLATQIGQLATFPLTYLSQNTTLFNWLTITVLFIMCVQEIGGYFLWYRKAKQATEERGEFVETKGHSRFQLTMVGGVFASLILLLVTIERRLAAVMLVALVSTFGLMFAVMGIQAVLKRMKVSRSTNRTVTIGACVVLSIVMVGALGFGLMALVNANVWEEREPVETYEAGGLTWEIYHDELLLTVEDLLETDYDSYSYEAEEEGSLLISTRKGSQEAKVQELAPEIHYEVYDIHLPFLYEMCKEELFTEYDNRSYEEDGVAYFSGYLPMDASLWGAEEAYQLYQWNNAYDWYLLCYQDRIVTVQFNWEVTEDQMAVVGEIL